MRGMKHEDNSFFPVNALDIAPVGGRIRAAKTDDGICAEQIETTLHMPALDKTLLDVGQIKVLQLAGTTPIITNEARLLKQSSDD